MSIDVIVVGNGIVGSAISLELLSKGLSVTILGTEFGTSQSATLASGAMLGVVGEVTSAELKEPFSTDFKFRMEAGNLYNDFIESINNISGSDLEISKGTYIIASCSKHEDVKNIKAMFQLAKENNYKAKWVDTPDVPWYQPSREHIASHILYLGDEGYINSRNLLDALHQAIAKFGTQCKQIYSEVSCLEIDKERLVGIKTIDGEKFFADATILCAGFGIQKIIENSNIDVNFIPKILGGRGTSLHMNNPDSSCSLDAVIRTPNRDFACGTHIVPYSNDLLYVGATNRLVDKQSGIGSTLGELHSLSHSAIHEVNTGLRTSHIKSIHSGIRPYSSDGQPLIGISDIEKLYLATATYRNGVLMAPLIAKIIASEITTDQSYKYQNPYSPKQSNRRRLYDSNELIQDGIKNLVSFIQEPHGKLPYNREKELELLLTLLFSNVLADKNEINHDALQNAKELLRKQIIPEVIPSIYYLLQNGKT
jgi:glycine oxidase